MHHPRLSFCLGLRFDTHVLTRAKPDGRVHLLVLRNRDLLLAVALQLLLHLLLRVLPVSVAIFLVDDERYGISIRFRLIRNPSRRVVTSHQLLERNFCLPSLL